MTASDFLTRYWDESIPVDPITIAQRAGIRLEALPLNVPDSFSGEYDPQGASGPVIRYNASHSLARQRFTIAHELGHHAHGHGLSYRDDNPVNFSANGASLAETLANRFAADLLMPRYILEYVIGHEPGHGLSSLAQRFGVSEAAMYWRMKNLGMLDHG
jgi:Zn-dependent peptidase ImmA (M78 family)